MAVKSLLVFGATGVTGHPVVDAALEAGLEVRAASRRVGEAEGKLSQRVEVVEADLAIDRHVEEAMDGIDAVFFHLPTLREEVNVDEMVDNVLAGASRQGLQRIVFTTGGPCGEEMPPGTFVNTLRAISRKVHEADVPAVVLRPTLYLANLVWPHLIRQIREYGQLTYPPMSSRRRVSWTATEDQGRIAVASLQADFAGETIDVASPEPVTGPELCRMLARAYGREVHFAPQNFEDFAETVSHMSGSAQVGRMISDLHEGIDNLDEDGPIVDTATLESRFGVALTPVTRWVEERLARLIELYG